MLEHIRTPLGRTSFAVALALMALSSARGVPFPATMSLSELNGKNGFRINGVEGFTGDNGLSVASAGDVNNDGIDDIAIGISWLEVNGVGGAGKAYIVFGTPAFPPIVSLGTLDGSNGFVMTGTGFQDQVGSAVATGGDFNDDGIDDLIVGAQGVVLDFFSEGQAYVVYGQPQFPDSLNLQDLDGSNGFKLNGIGAFYNTGQAVAAAGDQNGDGLDDILVGAHRANPGGRNSAGSTYVVFGNAAAPANLDLEDLDGCNGFTINGAAEDDFSGLSLSSVDVNGDGQQDMFIGAPESVGEPGQAYVVFGNPEYSEATFELLNIDGTNGFKIAPDPDGGGGQLGFSVSGAGDVNGDGIEDLILGARTVDGANVDTGEAYVIFGATQFTTPIDVQALDGTDGFRIPGKRLRDQLGYSVSGVGDFNGDGLDDVVIGAKLADVDGMDSAGKAYVIFGATTFGAELDVETLDGSNGFTLEGIRKDYLTGDSVAGAGDVNADGYPDIIVGAAGADPGGVNNATQSYVIYGRSTAPLAVAIEGVCPGTVTVSISDALPGGRVAVFTADADGAFTLPAGPCSGLELGLEGPDLGPILVAGDDGSFVASGTAPAGACGRFVQVVDIATCSASNVAQLP